MNHAVWLRNDLRLHDNPALMAAAAQGNTIAFYTPAVAQWRQHGDSAVKIDFWLRSLHALTADLAALNIPLKLLPVENWQALPQVLSQFCQTHAIKSLHVNREWGANERQRDARCAQQLAQQGVDWVNHHGSTLLIPGTILSGSGEPYRMFTPYAKACRQRLRQAPPLAIPSPPAQAHPPCPSSILPNSFSDELTLSSSQQATLQALWPAGEMAAQTRLQSFIENSILRYKTQRDFPAIAGTSQLSPYLAAGVLSVHQCLRAALACNQNALDSGNEGVQQWVTELLWREFYWHLLATFPDLSKHRPMRPQLADVPWRDAPDDLQAWQTGHTGIPIVDAAQRQLLSIGWMHNRLRMISAMFLSKNLLIDWRKGEAWFMQHLIDGELAANNGGWQWCASTGSDSVPYFRIFNPIAQSRKFDPEGAFLRRWLPELADLDQHDIHEPSTAQRVARGYPIAMVDLKQSRLRAIETFRTVRNI